MTRDELPSYQDLMYPTLRAVEELGGSAQGRALGRFTAAARKAAIVSRPTVDLIDGDRLCDLVEQQEIGVRKVPQVQERGSIGSTNWAPRFAEHPRST